MIERRLGFIGAGVMAEALLKGMLASGAAASEMLYAADPSPERRSLFAQQIGDNVLADNVGLMGECDVVVLSVKPQLVPTVAAEVSGHVKPEHLIVSIAAGVRLSSLHEMLGRFTKSAQSALLTTMRLMANRSQTALGQPLSSADSRATAHVGGTAA